jgi:hypothetical protein
MFFMNLYKALWSLLFVIPGIIKGYEYRMIPYILAENPELDKNTVFRLSKEMMDGEKWDAFVLDISFIGWILLSLCTCGLLSVFYVSPYINMTSAQLYETLKHRATMDYYDHTMGVWGETGTVYGNPGAYSGNAPQPYDSPDNGYEQTYQQSGEAGESAYQLPDDNE